MFKNTQLKVWMSATSCPSPGTVFITRGAVVKATIAHWGVQAFVLKNSVVKENTNKQLPGSGRLCVYCFSRASS